MEADGEYMNLQCFTWDDEEFLELTENLLAFLPFQDVYLSPYLVAPYIGVMQYNRELLPVEGPAPLQESPRKQGWLLVYEDHAKAVRHIPDFIDDTLEKPDMEKK